MTLTGHTAAMDLVIQFSGDRVVPWQRSGPGSEFLMGTASEQGAITFMAHGQVVQDLEHVE